MEQLEARGALAFSRRALNSTLQELRRASATGRGYGGALTLDRTSRADGPWWCSSRSGVDPGHRQPATDAQVDWRVLPPIRAATVIYRSECGGLARASDALGHWLHATGRPTAGRLRIVYLQFGAEPELRVPAGYLVGRDADFVTELQLELA